MTLGEQQRWMKRKKKKKTEKKKKIKKTATDSQIHSTLCTICLRVGKLSGERACGVRRRGGGGEARYILPVVCCWQAGGMWAWLGYIATVLLC